jgi:hypothetical protein
MVHEGDDEEEEKRDSDDHQGIVVANVVISFQNVSSPSRITILRAEKAHDSMKERNNESR